MLRSSLNLTDDQILEFAKLCGIAQVDESDLWTSSPRSLISFARIVLAMADRDQVEEVSYGEDNDTSDLETK